MWYNKDAVIENYKKKWCEEKKIQTQSFGRFSGKLQNSRRLLVRVSRFDGNYVRNNTILMGPLFFQCMYFYWQNIAISIIRIYLITITARHTHSVPFLIVYTTNQKQKDKNRKTFRKNENSHKNNEISLVASKFLFWISIFLLYLDIECINCISDKKKTKK